jgi:hypothetical protein
MAHARQLSGFEFLFTSVAFLTAEPRRVRHDGVEGARLLLQY